MEIPVTLFLVDSHQLIGKEAAEKYMRENVACPTCGSPPETDWVNVTCEGHKPTFVPGTLRCPICWP
jgi:formate dehydrogenase maturation protein FdhE